jgi:hypothetical protein
MIGSLHFSITPKNNNRVEKMANGYGLGIPPHVRFVFGVRFVKLALRYIKKVQACHYIIIRFTLVFHFEMVDKFQLVILSDIKTSANC